MLMSKWKGKHLTGRIELPQGTLDLLILRTLLTGPQHGWAISERVQQVSSEVLSIQQGSLYPALHRLERRGWIKARWGTSDNNRRAKYYELTRSGEKQLEAEDRSLAQAVRCCRTGAGRSVASMLDDLRYRARALFRHNEVETELDEELRFHFDREVEKYMSSRHDRRRSKEGSAYGIWRP